MAPSTRAALRSPFLRTIEATPDIVLRSQHFEQSTTNGVASRRELVYYVAVSLDGRIAGPGGEFRLCGGGRLAGALLPEIDRLNIKSYPAVAGAGIPAFDGAFDPTLFSVTVRHSFANDVTVTWFTRR